MFARPEAKAVEGFASYGSVEYLKPVAAFSFVESLIPPEVRRALTGSNWRAPPMISAA